MMKAYTYILLLFFNGMTCYAADKSTQTTSASATESQSLQQEWLKKIRKLEIHWLMKVKFPARTNAPKIFEGAKQAKSLSEDLFSENPMFWISCIDLTFHSAQFMKITNPSDNSLLYPLRPTTRPDLMLSPEANSMDLQVNLTNFLATQPTFAFRYLKAWSLRGPRHPSEHPRRENFWHDYPPSPRSLVESFRANRKIKPWAVETLKSYVTQFNAFIQKITEMSQIPDPQFEAPQAPTKAKAKNNTKRKRPQISKAESASAVQRSPYLPKRVRELRGLPKVPFTQQPSLPQQASSKKARPSEK